MKSFIIFILCVLPFSSYAKLKDSCSFDGRSYLEEVKIEMIFGYQGVIDPKYMSLGGVEIKENNGQSFTVIIHKDDYYLFNAAKNAYLMNKNINVCLTKDRLEHPFRHLLGVEMN
ncbi:hypothetical protein [Morganella psychrotolerans]|uniref:Adhesin n=1 Tax=Morganella psychrotolerans TaxID=368603 RepID=A0A1B8HRP8_9GAMM|nr:hypothetical protein [Morganella psychrotolerans]OBU12097.1 hypothetical protein AYY18_17250 [Morganella psychrotolerans]